MKDCSPGGGPRKLSKFCQIVIFIFSFHSSFPCKQFDLDVNHQEMLWWDKCSGLCRGHAKLYSRGGRTWGYPLGCLSPVQRVYRAHSSAGQGSLVSLPGTHSCVQDRHLSSTLVSPHFPHAWLKTCLSWAGARLHAGGHSVPSEVELCCERQMDFKPF